MSRDILVGDLLRDTAGATEEMLVADLLCGAGGSSTGCEQALAELGLKMKLVCVNHWPIAIETHKANHPLARHYCQDIATVRPHIVVPEGYLDLLLASPTCTHHSVARGGKPTSDQQRSDPWHIITWFTELRVKRAIIENVWEFTGWGPVDPATGRPIKDRKGEYHAAWIDTIRKLGATSIEWRKLNSAMFGAATTRQRYFCIIRFDGKPIVFPAATHRKREPGVTIIPGGLKPWRAAREIIDWSIKGKSIFSRKTPLAPKTLDRLLAGALKFDWPVELVAMIAGELERSLLFFIALLFNARNKQTKAEARRKCLSRLGQNVVRLRRLRTEAIMVRASGSSGPMLVTLRRNADARSIDLPIPALAAAGTHVALAQPVMLANRSNNVPKAPDADPAPCFTTAPGGGIALAEAMIISPRHGKEGAGPRPRAASEPVPTISAGGSQFAVAEPVMVNGRKNNKAKPVSTEPVPALDTKGGVWLAEPFVLATGSSGAPRATSEPLPTATTGGAGTEDHPGCARPMLAEPFVATVAHGNDADDATANVRRSQSVEQPLGTVQALGGKFGLAEAFVLSRQGGGAPRSVDDPTPAQVAKHSRILIMPYYGSGSGETCGTVENPLPACTAKARFGIVMPVTHSDSSNRARDVEVDPLPTLTTARRGELAFIAAQFGEREGQEPRVHDLDEPLPTPCATGHVNLVQGVVYHLDLDACRKVYDVLFRMLEPHELAAAMGFTSDEARYVFAGNKTEQVKQIGNAVEVRTMRALVRAVMADEACDVEQLIAAE
jgi:DNA (cytosine-5)-methyltransferase 1